MSVIIHEVSHGYMAKMLGDNTADYAGRLTLNPIKHLDPIGSILVPVLLVLSHAGFVFGWAKPVPFNPNNLRDKKFGVIKVALAGIASNFALAIVFGLVIRVATGSGFTSQAFISIIALIVLVNLVLGIFNLIPIPPLDGSKVFFALLPFKYRNIEIFMEQYSFIVLILFILFAWKFVAPVIFILFHLLTGLAV